MLHHEKLPSAIERYQNEVHRILSVLETVLSANASGWLVGEKCTFADLAFLPYNDRVEWFLGCPRETKFEKYPHVKDWHERMLNRPTWKKSMEIRNRLMDEQGLLPSGMPKGSTGAQELHPQ